jgi:hypothetical protein
VKFGFIAKHRNVWPVAWLHREILQHRPTTLTIGYLSPVEFQRKVRLA